MTSQHQMLIIALLRYSELMRFRLDFFGRASLAALLNIASDSIADCISDICA